jgi:hypothetical protein
MELFIGLLIIAINQWICQFLNKDETEHNESAMELQRREKKKVEILLIVKKLITKKKMISLLIQSSIYTKQTT